MLDNLFSDIGVKLKDSAKWIFVVEAIASIIGGIVMIFSDIELILIGLLIILGGLAVALFSARILYAFGELVDKACENAKYRKDILNYLTGNPTPLQPPVTSKTYPQTANGVIHKWRCDNCGNMRTQTPCEFCGINESSLASEPEVKKYVFVAGNDIPAGKLTVNATAPDGGMVLIFSKNNEPLDKIYVKSKEKIKVNSGDIVKLFDCVIE